MVYGFDPSALGLSPAFAAASITLLTLWSIAWKGWALWIAARKGSKPWFVALLVVNTLGILEILYIFVFSKKGAVAAETPAAPMKP
jgi:hypothetical protein